MLEQAYQLHDLEDQRYRFIVLSGCSGGGKSTLLTELNRRGFTVFEEPGRQLIKEQQYIEGTAYPWTNPLQFVELSVSRSINQMVLASRVSRWAFFDRGIVDAVSFLEHLNLSVPPHLENAVQRLRYSRLVFLVPPWPEIFAKDTERQHSFEEAVANYESLVRTYERLGYTPVLLPKIAVEKRADFVIGRLTTNHASQAEYPQS